MTRYALVVDSATNVRSVVEVLRRHSTLGVAELARRIGGNEPAVEFDTWGFELSQGYDDGVPAQHSKLRMLIDELEGLGAVVSIIRHTVVGDKAISRNVLENMLESELISLRQEND
jgi:hypothetical protein